MNIKEVIASYQEEVSKATDLLPGRAAEILAELSALIGNVNEEIRRAEMAYNFVLKSIYEQETKANRAKILAETSPEYQARMEARDTKELVIEMIRSLKYLVRSKEEEMMHSGGM